MPASEDTVQRLLALYRDCDAKFAGVLNMGVAWRETVVALATEFGRTARIYCRAN
jgi:uncharacterized protein (DUF1501 family)